MYRVLAAVLLLSSTLDVLVLASEFCGITDSDGIIETPSDDNRLYATINCSDTLTVSYHHDISHLGSGRRIDLHYECTDYRGNKIDGPIAQFAVLQSRSDILQNAPQFVVGTAGIDMFLVPGTSCVVFGCFAVSTEIDDEAFFANNGSCRYEGGPTTEPPTISVATTENTTIGVTVDTQQPTEDTPQPISTSSLPIASSVPLSPSTTISNTPMVTLATSIAPTTAHASPLTSSSSADAVVRTTDVVVSTATFPGTGTTGTMSPLQAPGDQTAVLVLVVLFSVLFLVLLCSVTCFVCVTVKARQVYRRKHPHLYFTNYSEKIDPSYNPINVTSRIKTAVSVVSVFDTFYPYQIPTREDSDSQDGKSVILQATNPIPESSSVNSIVCEENVLSETASSTDCASDSYEELVERKDIVDNQPSTKQDRVNSTGGQYIAKNTRNGYVTSYYPTEEQRAHQVPFQVQYNMLPPPSASNSSRGYVMDRSYPSPPLQGQAAVSTPTSEYIKAEDVVKSQRSLPSRLTWNKNEVNLDQKFHPFTQRQASSVSSGYVTESDVSTPTSMKDSVIALTADASKTSSLERRLYQKYKVENGYTYHCDLPKSPVLEEDEVVLDEFPKEVQFEASDSDQDVAEDDDCSEGSKFADQVFAENLLAECSLSLNPLHFEPIDDDNGYDSSGSSPCETMATEDNVYNCIPSLLSNEAF